MTTSMLYIILSLISLVVGVLIGWFISQSKAGKSVALLTEKCRQLESSNNELYQLNQKLSIEKEDYFGRFQSIAGKVSVLEEEQNRAQQMQLDYQAALNQLAAMKEQLNAANEKLLTQKADLEKLSDTFRFEFKNLAQGILDEKTQKFTEANEKNMKAILDPLKTEIGDFKQKVEETYDRESKERFSLGREVQKLVESSQLVSEQAHNLSTALKGNKKLQGNWGEMILETILENSGLIKGQHFQVQDFIRDAAGAIIKDENGRGLQPDVTIYYPDERKVIIDSKVSLIAYEASVSADLPEDAAKMMDEHVRAIKGHVDGLSKKNYPKYAKTLDYVLMFVPIEPAFLEAVKSDQTLWKYAYDKGIILVSPTNLLAILKIVEEMWKVDKQTKNAEAIAEQAGAIYEKFVGFLHNFKSVGDSLGAAQRTYEDAYKQLATGKGNFSRQVERLKDMGAKTVKHIPTDFLLEE
ncbi:DNA recombination protein RmuC [Lacibacter sediminis]|uniref:DNA recombination protein RmuC n=1 Tax=Lacibacter sediminis TaxID=2760713 RepID=A0A7G5XFQ5_9BACT|nr:DNA recombination protein RmuC [Lacibacter sediminis]QNA44308.1 DNA recombination protein RmuC [Lacibacter sediminis]